MEVEDGVRYLGVAERLEQIVEFEVNVLSATAEADALKGTITNVLPSALVSKILGVDIRNPRACINPKSSNG